VPAILELYDIPYTFSDPLVCAMTLDKEMAKKIVRDAGLNTPRSCLVACEADIKNVKLNYPLFAKPVAEGTGKGVDSRSKITSPAQLDEVCKAQLKQFHQPVLVEEYLPGRESTTAILGTGPKARVLGTMEIASKKCPAQDSTKSKNCAKNSSTISRCPKLCPAKVEDLALACYLAWNVVTPACRYPPGCGWQPSFIELNPLPGLHPHHSDLPMIATQEGMSYKELLASIINSALAKGDS
jgi:D-alanine-D-alanine ligase